MARKHVFEREGTGVDDAPVKYEYECRLMPPMLQHQVLRRVLPLVASRIAGTMAGGTRAMGVETVAQMIAAMSDLKDAEHDYVMDALLSYVQRRRVGESHWAPVWVGAKKSFAFEDIGLMDMYTIANEVVEFTYGGFFALAMKTFAERAAAEPS